MEKGYLMGVCYLETSTLKNQKNQLQEHSPLCNTQFLLLFSMYFNPFFPMI